MTDRAGTSPGAASTAGSATRRSAIALGVLLTALAVANVVRSTAVPGRWHFVFNLGIGVLAAAVAVAARLDRDELGLAWDRVRSGLRYGGVAFALTSAVVVVLGAAGALDDGAPDASASDVARKVLVVIPLATVLTEELVFRGTLHALLTRLLAPRRAVVIGAVLFGLWHVFPTWWGGGVDAGGVEVNRTAAALGTFAATTAAGFVFLWLRVRSESLVAPILLHLATNSVTYAVAWWWG